jgi:hypothetical protein
MREQRGLERTRESWRAYISFRQRIDEGSSTPREVLTHTYIPSSLPPSHTGVDAEEAKARINKDMPGLNVIVLPKVRKENKKGRLCLCVLILFLSFSIDEL